MGDVAFIRGEPSALVTRGISEEVCKKYRYEVGKVPADHKLKEWRGKTVQIENYYDHEGSHVGQKLRDKDKKFTCIGNVSDCLFGSHFVKPGSSKMIVLTEGAIDAMSYTEVRKTWYALSIPNGATSAKRTIKANLDYLESFEKVVVCFDNDEPGERAVESIKGILSPGKLHIATLSGYKDLNEALQAGDYKAITSAIYQTEEVRPDGIVEVDDILEDVLKPVEWGLPWFVDELTKLTYGRRRGELYGLGAPTGGGKTDLLTEQIAFDVKELGLKVGCLFLEQKPTETVQRLAGKIMNRTFHIPDSGWTKEELQQGVEPFRTKLKLYDSWGETSWESVKNRIRYMAMAHGIYVFYVDHLTAMADTADEKGSLEQIMKELAGLANELNLIITYVSHLTTPEGTPHEEGGRIAVRHFKGSRAIGFWSYFMFALERDQQADSVEDRQRTTFRVLKDRYTGQATGQTFYLGYDPKHGRILPPGSVRAPSVVDTEDEEF